MTDTLDGYDIRPAVADDIGDVAELWCVAFPAKRTVEDRARMLEEGGRYGGLETVLVARDRAGRLGGACKIYRLTQYITGVAMPMMGLAAVAVAPPERRRGLGAALCRAALEAAADRGDALSVLYPFRPDYYERLGWGLVGALDDHRFHTASLPAHDEAAAVRVARLESDADAIAACYDRVARTSHGPIERDRKLWSYRLTGEELGVRPLGEDAIRAAEADPRRRVVVWEDAGRVDGYALLRYHLRTSAEENTLVVQELVSASESAYRGLLGHLARQADRWPRMRHFARPGERFEDRLRDPRPPGFRDARSLYFPTARRIRGPMLRVVDVPAALRARRWFKGDPDHRPLTFTLAVEDPELPANHGPWRVRIEAGKAEVQPADGARITASADASTFARIYAGELRPADAVRLGRARVEEAEASVLDAAFATRESFWLLDEF